MKIKIHVIISAVLIVAAVCFGLILKQSYKEITEDVGSFYVGLLEDSLVGNEITVMRQTLSDSRYILLVTCKDEPEFGFSYGSQKVKVDSVIKGSNELEEGDEIRIITIKEIYLPGEDRIGSMNYNFVNKLKMGQTYLVFLDRKVETDLDGTLFVYNEDYFMSPLFGIEETQASAIQKELSDGYFAKYENVKDNDVFLMSEDAIADWDRFREEVVTRFVTAD